MIFNICASESFKGFKREKSSCYSDIAGDNFLVFTLAR